MWLEDFHIPLENIHRIKGELPPQNGVEDYINELRLNAAAEGDVPDFDLVYLGLGSDGHTASLFPGSELDDEHTHVKMVSANYLDRPSMRITLTPGAFAFASQIVFLVSGAEKAQAVARTLTGPMDVIQYPAQRIKPHQGRIDWFLDAGSAALLPNNLNVNQDSEELWTAQ